MYRGLAAESSIPHILGGPKMIRTEYYIGMDVHKDSVQMAVFAETGEEPIYERRLSNNTALLLKEAGRFNDKGKTEAAYEAGSLGYVIHRVLEQAGISCYVLPANKVAKKRTERIKTDKRDARLIGRELRSKSIRPIVVPDEVDEAARDLLRCREDVIEDLRRAKQRLLKFMVRHGHIYTGGGNNWTLTHWRWMDRLPFKQEHERMVYEEYRSQINSLEERVIRLEEKIVATAESPRYKAAVSRLRVFKGIDYIIALSVLCEIGDFHRFAGAKDFMSYIGLVPSESSSGGKRNQGSITKAGNGHLRKLLIEGAWHYTKNSRPGKRLEKRRQGYPASLIDAADRALHRLHKKYMRLIFAGKHKNVAVTAVARELAGFIWAVQVNAG
jgi:transposase